MGLIHYSHSGEKAGTMMHFGGNIGEVRESLFCIASSERHTKRQDGEEQKDEPPQNGALSISSLKERIEEDNELTRTYTDLTRVQVSCKCRCRRERMEWIWKSKTLRY